MLFADDMTCFLKDKLSYLHLFVTLKYFSRFSGLCVNDEKTELFAIGPQKLLREEFYHKVCTSIKILFDYHKPTRKSSNFNNILKSIQKVLNLWKLGEVLHYSAGFRSSRRLLFPNLCIKPH